MLIHSQFPCLKTHASKTTFSDHGQRSTWRDLTEREVFRKHSVPQDAPNLSDDIQELLFTVAIDRNDFEVEELLPKHGKHVTVFITLYAFAQVCQSMSVYLLAGYPLLSFAKQLHQELLQYLTLPCSLFILVPSKEHILCFEHMVLVPLSAPLPLFDIITCMGFLCRAHQRRCGWQQTCVQ